MQRPPRNPFPSLAAVGFAQAHMHSLTLIPTLLCTLGLIPMRAPRKQPSPARTSSQPYFCFARQASIHVRASAACGALPLTADAPLLEAEPVGGWVPVAGWVCSLSWLCCRTAMPTVASAATLISARPPRFGPPALVAAAPALVAAAPALVAAASGACAPRMEIF